MTSPRTTYFPAAMRGKGEYGWLSTRYSFSFAQWYAPDRMGFGTLRVLNDDRIQGGAGFGMHGHRDMEIITIVTKGTLRHTDNIGTDGLVTAGEVQVMSAGTGILHSEVNPTKDTLELFQLWITPHTKNVVPRYAQKTFDVQSGETLLVAPMGHPTALTIYQDAYISRLTLSPHESAAYTVKHSGNGVYAFMVDGTGAVSGQALRSRDALGIEGASEMRIEAGNEPLDLLIIEVPMQ